MRVPLKSNKYEHGSEVPSNGFVEHLLAIPKDDGMFDRIQFDLLPEAIDTLAIVTGDGNERMS
jgi:hypothetical protein